LLPLNSHKVQVTIESKAFVVPRIPEEFSGKMKFQIIPTKKFLEQAKDLDEKTKRIVDDKLDLLKENPYRFKSLHYKKLKLFRIRLNVQNRDIRLVYTVIKPDVILLCFIERKKDYKDLDKYIKQFTRK